MKRRLETIVDIAWLGEESFDVCGKLPLLTDGRDSRVRSDDLLERVAV